VRFEGLGDLQKLLDGMKHQIKQELSGEVTLRQLLTDEYVRANTNFQNFQQFREKCPYPLTENDTQFHFIQDPSLNLFISQHSDFHDWRQILHDAKEEYALSRVKSYFEDS